MTSTSTPADVADAIRRQAVTAGASTPTIRGADWQTATVTTVNTDGTVDCGTIRARRLETYQNPLVGDRIVITQSGSGNWLACGRTSTGADAGWTQVTLATGFSHNGNSNGTVAYRVVVVHGTRFAQWRGGLGITYSGNAIQNSGNFLNAALPTTARPSVLRTVTVACSASSSSSYSLKIDFKTDGTTTVVGTTTSTSDTYSTPIIRPPWVSLNNVQYSLD